MRFGGKYSTNVYVEGREDMPRFPAQLGCQGFAVLDSEHRFMTIRTKAWTQVRDEAFREVEQVLGGLCSKNSSANNSEESKSQQPVTSIPVGCVVELGGLRKAQELNGQVGTVKDIRDGRLIVSLETGEKDVLVLETNLVRTGSLAPVDHEEMDDEHANLTRLVKDACHSLTRSHILAVRDAFADHAGHEERLLAAIDKGSEFSTMKSHSADHARILQLADEAASAQTFDALRIMVNAIYDHADNFDTQYAGRI